MPDLVLKYANSHWFHEISLVSSLQSSIDKTQSLLRTKLFTYYIKYIMQWKKSLSLINKLENSPTGPEAFANETKPCLVRKIVFKQL